MFKKGFEGKKWNGKHHKVLIAEENAEALKRLGADVFDDKPKKKKKKDDSSKQE
jgi:hypothetical protein